MAAVAAVVAIPSVALAAAEPTPPVVNVDTTDVSTITVAAPLVTIIVSLLIPVLNGLLTKPSTPTAVKAIGTIILNAAAALIINGVVSDGSSTFSDTTLYTALLGAVISIVSYVGIYKPINVTSNEGGKLANVGNK